MQFLFDLLPIILFFVAFKLTADLTIATILAIIITLLQLLVFRFKRGYYHKVHLISFASILFLGGATICFKNEQFIKWKPTVVYWIFATALLISQYLGRQPLMQRLMGNNLSLPEKLWKYLNSSWAIFCIIIGIANLYVAYNFDTDLWVNFKLFGTLGLTLLFIIVQAIIISRFVKISN